MKHQVYAQASTYQSEGWRYEFVKSDVLCEIYYIRSNGYYHIGEVDVPKPTINMLVQLGLAKVEDMKQDAAQDRLDSERNIAEYEAKFMMLSAPVAEELS